MGRTDDYDPLVLLEAIQGLAQRAEKAGDRELTRELVSLIVRNKRRLVEEQT